MEDIRWKQRFMNYEKALDVLRNFTTVEKLNIREEQGLIKAFEYTYELGWNAMKDFLLEKGNNERENIINVKQLSYQIAVLKTTK